LNTSSLRLLAEGMDHFANAPACREARTVAQNFKAYEGQPLSFPAEAAGPKAEYLEYHRSEVFGKV